MSKKTLRTQNKCKDCGYTWYPRGKDLSSSCPNCGGKNVGYAGSGALVLIGIVAVAIYVFSHRDSDVRGADTANQPVVNRPAMEEQPAPSARQLEAAPVAPNPKQTKPSDVEPQKAAATTVAPSQKNFESPDIAAVPEDARNKVFTDDEIDKLEEEKQYHGDDPIVRARLGLPSKTTKRLEP